MSKIGHRKMVPAAAAAERDELFVGFAEMVARYLVEGFGFGHERAALAGLGIADLVRSIWAGQTLYIPYLERKYPKVTPRMAVRRAELFACFSERVSAYLVKDFDFDAGEQSKVAAGVLEVMRDAWGGQNIYIPRRIPSSLEKRDWEIYERMQRGNANELAAEYGLSFVRIYGIVRQCARKLREEAARRDSLAGRLEAPVATFSPRSSRPIRAAQSSD